MNRRTVIARLLAASGTLAAGPRRSGAEPDWEALIRDAAHRHGVDAEWLVAVARCESDLDPAAVGAHGEVGIFQFMPETFRAWGGADVHDPHEQIELAAWAFSQGLACDHWVCAGCPGGLQPW